MATSIWADMQAAMARRITEAALLKADKQATVAISRFSIP
jgi:hypothetical protein